MTLAAAVRIGESLISSALWHEDRCTWVGPVLRDPREPSTSQYGALGPDLYAGTAGIAWFLGHLYSSTGERVFERTALGAIRHALFASRRLTPEKRCSFYAGTIGIAFVAVDLAKRLDAEEVERDARACLRDVVNQRNRERPLDLVTGTAGAIAALPILSVRMADEQLLDLAIVLGNQTIRRAESSRTGISWQSSANKQQRNLTGFSHGAAGIGYALLELFAATGDDRYRHAAEEAFDYERSWFDAGRENWPDFRGILAKSRSKSAVPFSTHWCHGAPGIALSRIRAWELLCDDRYRTEARAAIRTTRSAVLASLESDRGGFSLCHGLAGNAEILLEGSDLGAFEGDGLGEVVAEGARESEIRARSRRPGSPSLFLGLAGVGYLNIRLHDRRVPSLMMLRREQFV